MNYKFLQKETEELQQAFVKSTWHGIEGITELQHLLESFQERKFIIGIVPKMSCIWSTSRRFENRNDPDFISSTVMETTPVWKNYVKQYNGFAWDIVPKNWYAHIVFTTEMFREVIYNYNEAEVAVCS